MRVPNASCALVFVLSLAYTDVAAGQCNYPSAEGPNSGGQDCTAPMQSRDAWATYDLMIEVRCNSNGWKSDRAVANTLNLTAIGQCGPAQTGGPPMCGAHFYIAGFPPQGYDQWAVTGASEYWYHNGNTCDLLFTQFKTEQAPGPGCTGSFCCQWQSECLSGGGPYGSNMEWEPTNCNCYPSSTPLIVDVAGDGYKLTDSAGGVMFDLRGTGEQERVGWTSIGGDDAFLVWDRNQDGRIGDARELFGEVTVQLPNERPNGFEALRMLDFNSDGVVDARDPDFASLQLWTDRNHNGRSDGGELRSLKDVGITALSVEYEETKIRDMHGNVFKYRAPLRGGPRIGKYVYDVFLVRPTTQTTNP